jgi:hypothetical protein
VLLLPLLVLDSLREHIAQPVHGAGRDTLGDQRPPLQEGVVVRQRPRHQRQEARVDADACHAVER